MKMVTIRPATVDDLPGVLDLLQHLHPNDPPLSDQERVQAVWSSLIGSPLITLLVADLGNRLGATCTLVIVPNLTRGARSYGLIENVVTHPDHRRRGLGQSVLRAALGRAWAADCYKVMLATGSQNPGTLRFYESVSFERGGKTFFQAKPPVQATAKAAS